MVILNLSENEVLHLKEIANITGASENHLSKVFQRLSKHGFVKSIWGPKGGYYLAKPPDEITLLDIFETIEGKLEIKGCPFERVKCPFSSCIL